MCRQQLRRGGASPQDVEDLVQEAVVRLFAYTRKTGEVRNKEAFFTRTALNLAVDLHRSSHRDRFEAEPTEVLDLLDLCPAQDAVLAAEQRLCFGSTCCPNSECERFELSFDGKRPKCRSRDDIPQFRQSAPLAKTIALNRDCHYTAQHFSTPIAGCRRQAEIPRRLI